MRIISNRVTIQMRASNKVYSNTHLYLYCSAESPIPSKARSGLPGVWENGQTYVQASLASISGGSVAGEVNWLPPGPMEADPTIGSLTVHYQTVPPP